MLKKFLFTTIFFLGTLLYATPEEQIKASPRTWDNDGTRIGMPGLANIKVTDKNGNHHYAGMLPSGKATLSILLGHEIRYGGAKYRHLTVASGGRIFLGNYRLHTWSLHQPSFHEHHFLRVVSSMPLAKSSSPS